MKGRESGMPEVTSWETFFNPACILSILECNELQGDIVEFGCGYGTFTLPATKRTRGQVIAFDIDPGMVAVTTQRLTAAGCGNATVQERDFVALGTGLAAQSVQYVMLFNILHIEDPLALLVEAERMLSPGGKVGIIHWRSDIQTPRGPSAEIRPTLDDCIRWGEVAGLFVVKAQQFECCQWHWGVLLQKN